MAHPDAELLLRAVGGSADEATRQHIVTCSRCSLDVATMTRARAAGTALAAEPLLSALAAPPPELWAAIQREAAGPAAPTPVTALPVKSARGRTSRRWVLVAASVAASFVLGVLVASLAGRDDGRVTAAPVARTSVLSPYGAHVTRGTLSLSGPASRRSLSVALTGSDPGPGFLEVWLLDGRTGGMVSLGVLDGSRGSYALPAGLDMAAYDQVDVSREPFDGNPRHSQQSVARGALP